MLNFELVPFKTRHVSIIFHFVVTCAVFYCGGGDVNFAGVYFHDA